MPQMISKRRDERAVGIFLAVALTLAACSGAGSTASPSSQGSASAPSASACVTPTKVTVLTGYLWAQSQYYSQYLLGIDKGFYAAECLDVSFQEGQGSGSGSQLIANGQFDFGVSIAAGAAIRAISKGAPIKIIASVLPFNPIGVIYKTSSSLSSPQDLVGKKIGMPPGTEQAQLWPAFLAKNNLQASQVQLLNINAEALPAALGQGKIDGYVSYAFDLPSLKATIGDVKIMLVGDFGVNYAPGETLVASQKIIDQNPDLVGRLTRAIVKTVTYAAAHPDEAAAAGAKHEPEALSKIEVTLATSAIYNGMISSALQQGKLFQLSDAEIQGTLELLSKYAGLTGAKPASAYYTNQFLPTQ
jgi:NitT/TauT family transport system substrate-binding protein